MRFIRIRELTLRFAYLAICLPRMVLSFARRVRLADNP
jgi:hypothetical protein